jgi:hypothetical protein
MMHQTLACCMLHQHPATILLSLQLSRVYVGAVPEDAAAKDAAGNEGLQLLALQVMN